MSDFPENDMNDLEIKKRARRRLVGATVLALLAVIVLPMVVENSEEPHNMPDMHVSIPERGEESGLNQFIPDGEAEIARVDLEPDVALGVPEFSDETPPSLSEPSPPPPPAVAKPAPTPPVAQPSPPSRSGTADRDAEAARALALLNDSPSPAKEAGKGVGTQDRVFVQVGAFSKADRANKQAEELKKLGFNAYAEKAGKVTRVRIGPLPRSEGEQVLARLKDQGHEAKLSTR